MPAAVRRRRRAVVVRRRRVMSVRSICRITRLRSRCRIVALQAAVHAFVGFAVALHGRLRRLALFAQRRLPCAHCAVRTPYLLLHYCGQPQLPPSIIIMQTPGRAQKLQPLIIKLLNFVLQRIVEHKIIIAANCARVLCIKRILIIAVLTPTFCRNCRIAVFEHRLPFAIAPA